jgi:hypothetical protein
MCAHAILCRGCDKPGRESGQWKLIPIKTVAFGYFIIFNPDSVILQVERAFPGNDRVLLDDAAQLV